MGSVLSMHNLTVKVLLLMQLRVNRFLQQQTHNCGSFTDRMGERVVVLVAVGTVTVLANK